jgi:hypothetical protein
VIHQATHHMIFHIIGTGVHNIAHVAIHIHHPTIFHHVLPMVSQAISTNSNQNIFILSQSDNHFHLGNFQL